MQTQDATRLMRQVLRAPPALGQPRKDRHTLDWPLRFGSRRPAARNPEPELEACWGFRAFSERDDKGVLAADSSTATFVTRKLRENRSFLQTCVQMQ